jgi:hypothetical protein
MWSAGNAPPGNYAGRGNLHQQNNGSGPGFAVLRDFLVVGRFRPFAKGRLVGKGQQHDFVAVPRAFNDEGALVGGQQAPLESFQDTDKRRLVTSVGYSVSDRSLRDHVDARGTGLPTSLRCDLDQLGVCGIGTTKIGKAAGTARPPLDAMTTPNG